MSDRKRMSMVALHEQRKSLAEIELNVEVTESSAECATGDWLSEEDEWNRRQQILSVEMPGIVTEIIERLDSEGYRVENANETSEGSRYFHIGDLDHPFVSLRISDHRSPWARCTHSVIVRTNIKENSAWLMSEKTGDKITVEDIVDWVREAESDPTQHGEWV